MNACPHCGRELQTIERTRTTHDLTGDTQITFAEVCYPCFFYRKSDETVTYRCGEHVPPRQELHPLLLALTHFGHLRPKLLQV